MLGAITVAAGDKTTYAVINDGSGTKGTVWAWGDRGFGHPFRGGSALGDGIAGQIDRHSAVPVQVMERIGVPLTDVVMVAAGYGFALALDASHRVWAWGLNQYGQLGQGADTNNATYAVQVAGLPNTITFIAAGGFHAAATSAPDMDGGKDVWVWGKGNRAQIGNGTREFRNSVPARAAYADNPYASHGVLWYGTGGDHCLSTNSSAAGGSGASSWGNNSQGQLGDRSTNQRPRPVDVALPGH
jgi:alpha-tubulin suppressor-like RCC1 family protein